jgi:site-specific recombinase XerD
LEISFKKAAERAGLPKYYSIHSSRHTYATLLLAKSKNIRFVQKQLGHASIAMTSLYADVLPEMNQNLANAILK